MKITLNLATKPYADQGPAVKRLRIGMAVLAVLLLGLGWGWYHIHNKAEQMRAQQAEVERRIQLVRQEEAGYQAQMREPKNARVLTQAEFLNLLFDEKSFSWTAAMEELERVLPAGVQVTAIEPIRGKDGRLTLHLRVSGQRERAVEMIRLMEHSRRFAAPRLSGETSEATEQGGNLQPVKDAGKVAFDILAEYNPATLEERKREIAMQRRPAIAGNAMPGARAMGMPGAGGPRPQYVPPNRPGGTVRPGQTGMPQKRMPGGTGGAQ